MLNPMKSFTRSAPQERRRSTRFVADRAIKFTQVGTGEILTLTRIRDVSNTGLKITSHDPLAPKTVLKIDFLATHDLRPFSMKGVVVWSRQSSQQENLFYSGVVFLYAPKNAANIIRGIISPIPTSGCSDA